MVLVVWGDSPWRALMLNPTWPKTFTGWWLGTFFIFPYIGKNNSIFQRGRLNHQAVEHFVEMTWFPWSLDDTTMAPRMGSEADGFVYDQIKIGDEAIHSLRAGRHNFIQDWFWVVRDEIFPGYFANRCIALTMEIGRNRKISIGKCQGFLHVSQCNAVRTSNNIFRRRGRPSKNMWIWWWSATNLLICTSSASSSRAFCNVSGRRKLDGKVWGWKQVHGTFYIILPCFLVLMFHETNRCLMVFDGFWSWFDEAYSLVIYHLACWKIWKSSYCYPAW